ncbi:21223_t:CDS:2 [Cetraspora pellucida]|uniref:21223_t:CDS:1 n=1 Tax=Cetraspora pellucida TaxID=1433469 RepID=A0A9N9I702_9GLOM|nr:21223_t:CDS:2 [Cetraspora pellucida]
MPKQSKKLDPTNPNVGIVEQPAVVPEITDEYKSESEDGQEMFLSNDRIKEIKIWLENSKNYTISGVFNRLHSDLTALVKEKDYQGKNNEKLRNDVNSMIEQNQEYVEILDDSLELCKTILNNLEIKGIPNSYQKYFNDNEHPECVNTIIDDIQNNIQNEYFKKVDEFYREEGHMFLYNNEKAQEFTSLLSQLMTCSVNNFLQELKDLITKLKTDYFYEISHLIILVENRIIACINTTFISFSKEAYYTLPDDCVDIHGQYQLLNFLIQCKFKNPNYTIYVSEIREFLNMLNRRDNNSFIGFFVSNVELSSHALNELNSSNIKNRICVCSYHEIVDKIKEYAKILKNQQEELEKNEDDKKRKFIELECENKSLSEKYEISIKKLREENEELKKKINIIENQNKEITEKLEIQSQEFNKKLDLILNKLA